jgi:hypothetical protein
MPRVYELPTHLDVQDTLLFGLTARQLVRLAVGASIAYAIWNQTAALPPALRGTLTVGAAIIGLLLALLQPGGRPLDQWLFAALQFCLLPRRRLWRRDSAAGLQPTDASRGWADLQLQPAWTSVRHARALDENVGRRWQ